MCFGLEFVGVLVGVFGFGWIWGFCLWWWFRLWCLCLGLGLGFWVFGGVFVCSCTLRFGVLLCLCLVCLGWLFGCLSV